MSAITADSMKQKLQNWLMEDGYQIGQADDATADFHLNVTNPISKLVLEVAKPKVRIDLVGIGAGYGLTPNQLTRLRGIAERKREEMLAELKLTLITSGINFQFFPADTNNFVEKVVVSLDLWFDGITKHSFMTAFEKVSLSLVGLIVKFGTELGYPNDTRSSSSPSYTG
jgi:hypothetical protein